MGSPPHYCYSHPVMKQHRRFGGLTLVCACLIACGARSQAFLGTPTEGASGPSDGSAGATNVGASGAFDGNAGATNGTSGAFDGSAGATNVGASRSSDSGDGGVTDSGETGVGGGVFGAPNPAHACNGEGGAVSLGTFEGKPLQIQNKVNTNLPFAQFAPGSSAGERAELAGVGTVLRFRDSSVDYDHGGYVYLELQISGIPTLGQELTLDPTAVDNLHFQVGPNKAWDPVPGQKITVRGIARDDGMCLTSLAFELKRLKMQVSALDANEAKGTFEFQGVFRADIADYH